MTSRDQILRSIRRNLPQATELPDHSGPWTDYADLTQQFTEVLESVGGTCHVVQSVDQIAQVLAPLTGPEKVVVSQVPGLFPDGLSLETVADPHDLADVELAVMPGRLAVAENAGIWVDNAAVRHRVIYFLCQHLALVVPRRELVPHLAAAYEKIDPAGQSFGAFISGPSKTADIEQSLVKGAHGARTLHVFLTDW